MPTTDVVKQELRPFHDVIFEVIRSAGPHQMSLLGKLLKMIGVREKHNEIIEAWGRQRAQLSETHGFCLVSDDVVIRLLEIEWDRHRASPKGYGFLHVNDDLNDEVERHLLEQKREAEKGETDLELASSFDFNGKERALMFVVNLIIILMRGIPSHPLDLPTRRKINEIFRFFEIAKKISRAENEQEFQATIADLQSQLSQ